MSYDYQIIFDGTSLIRMDDAGLERLSYQLRYAWGQYLNNDNPGHISVSGSGKAIGSLVDTVATIQVNVQNRNLSGGADYPAYPTSVGSENVNTFSYTQDNTINPGSFNVGGNLDSDGILYFSDAENSLVSLVDSSNLKTILNHCLLEMYSGDEVGTYRVSTASPSDGGTWNQKTTMFTDTTFSAGTTTYNLYLKTAATPAGNLKKPIGIKDANTLQERTISYDGTLIQNILLPALHRRVNRGECLQYSVVNSGVYIGARNRGSFSDTSQSGTGTQSQNFGANDPLGQATSSQYWRALTPASAAINQTVKQLNILTSNLV